MRICYFDAFSGIAGDMAVGALVDAGADAAALVEALTSLGTGASFRLEKVRRGALMATRFSVEGGEQRRHRHLPQILQMIDSAVVGTRAKQNATAVFQRLARAEARVHGIGEDQVHFHEVGAVDSIADIVGACWALDALGIEQVNCSALNVGSGMVKTDHGMLPVPAPATALLLEGVPAYSAGPPVELTTPTGAALMATLAVSFGPLPPMTISGSGYGAGTKEFSDVPNVVRVLVGEASGATEAATVAVLEANIDDSHPQVLGYAMERLLARGALDVTMTPLWMKKQRPGVLLQVIARPEDREHLAAEMLRETSTLGLRITTAERRVQKRSIVEVETPHGRVRMKVTCDGFAPEYEDCRKLAEKAGVPLKQILAEATHAYLSEF